MIKNFYQYNEAISENLSLSDFLYLHLENIEVSIRYINKRVSIDKIKDEFGVQNFVDDYISLAKKNNQWAGGPLNREWANKYYKFFGMDLPYTDWKPTIDIHMVFNDGSIFIIEFSMITKNIAGMNWSLSPDGSVGAEFYKRDRDNSNWGNFSYDGYYDIIHRIIPGYNFNWEIDTTYLI